MRRDCSLVQLEDMLDRNLFIRISKSGIVNLMNVDSYKKYSLQGTTQGRYLTGGVPPVRFSM